MRSKFHVKVCNKMKNNEFITYALKQFITNEYLGKIMALPILKIGKLFNIGICNFRLFSYNTR